MSRRTDRRPRLAALAVALMLAASAVASAATPAARAAAPRPARAASPAAAAWRWWLQLWSSSLRPATGKQGTAATPSGQPARPAVIPGDPVPLSDQGSGVDPNGFR